MQTLFEVNYCSVTGQMTDVILSEAKNLGVAGQMLRLWLSMTVIIWSSLSVALRADSLVMTKYRCTGL